MGELFTHATGRWIPRSSSAQTSPNYQNSEHVVNPGANPAQVLSSSNCQVTLSTIGHGLSATAMGSANCPVGDLQMALSMPGQAMKAMNPAPGTVIGKAIKPVETGAVLIPVLVMLR
jgi:hypothetical protein